MHVLQHHIVESPVGTYIAFLSSFTLLQPHTVIPWLTSDPANEFFG